MRKRMTKNTIIIELNWLRSPEKKIIITQQNENKKKNTQQI